MKLSTTKHSMKMMWGCGALVLLAVIMALSGYAYALLFIIPCMLMMGAMMWMMLGGGTRGNAASSSPNAHRSSNREEEP